MSKTETPKSREDFRKELEAIAGAEAVAPTVVAPDKNSKNKPQDYYASITMAERFAEERQVHLRFVALDKGSYWVRYMPKLGVWEETPDSIVATEVEEWLKKEYVLALEQGTADDKRRALACRENGFAQRVMKSASGRMHVDRYQFDTHPHLVVCRNGVVDLRSGEVTAFSPDLFLTQRVDIAYKPDAASEKWSTILSAAPEEIHDWLSVVFGQALTGERSKLFLFFVGSAHTGKSKFLDTMKLTAGDYHFRPDKKMLSANGGAAGEFSRIDFKGKRQGIMEELREDHIDGHVIKEFVDTDEMPANVKFRSNETVKIQANLFVACNALPAINGSDEGIRRRIAPVRFPYHFVEKVATVRDEHGNEVAHPGQRLAVGAVDEWLNSHDEELLEAAFAWRVRGAIKWFGNKQLATHMGLPAAIAAEKAAWIYANDPVAEWLEGHLVADPHFFVLAEDARDSYNHFQGGRTEMGRNTFNSRFEAALRNLFGDAAQVRRDTAWKSSGQSHSEWRNPKDHFANPRKPNQQRERYVAGVRFRTQEEMYGSKAPAYASAEDETLAAMEDDLSVGTSELFEDEEMTF